MNRHEQIRAVHEGWLRAPTPDVVHDGKARMDRGERLPDTRASRLWYCRSCGYTSTGAVIPAGWYALTRHTGAVAERPARLGVYCSAECLNAQMPRLIGIEDAAGDSWRESAYRQQGDRS